MNSIPYYSYVVNNFTILASQSKYRLFNISFTIAISILLLVVSHICFAQFQYADLKKLSKLVFSPTIQRKIQFIIKLIMNTFQLKQYKIFVLYLLLLFSFSDSLNKHTKLDFFKLKTEDISLLK